MPRASPQTTKSIPVPAPVNGINAVTSAFQLEPADAISLVNMIGGKLGVTSRLGYQDFATAVNDPTSGSASAEVRSVIPFQGKSASFDRLFVANKSGIWDVTAGGVQAVLTDRVFTFPVKDDNAGWGVSTAFVTNGDHYVLYADESNGLLLYKSSTDTWTAVPHGTGAGQIGNADPTKDVDPANIVFVTAWKHRLWFGVRDSADVFYLDVGLVTGTTSKIAFGNKFRSGGKVIGVYNWTQDGGLGIDDYMVVVSSVGDVLIYQGTDPTGATWQERGYWAVGAVPVGRRIATDFGGDMLLLSSAGVVPMSKLRDGTIGPSLHITQKIQPIFNAFTTDAGSFLGWSMRMHPAENALVINIPAADGTFQQLALSLATGAWSILQGIPSLSSEVWRGQYYFGTRDGRVCISTGGLDDASNTPRSVEWSGQCAHQSLGTVQRKRIQFIEPQLITNGPDPGVEVAARYDFATDPISTNPAEPQNTDDPRWAPSAYKEGVWGGPGITNQSYWGGRTRPFSVRRGAAGWGEYASLAFRGKSTSRVTLLGFNVAFDLGGIL